MDFVIWGIENQQKIHYAMPLRHMIEDALSYLKEYNEIAKKNLDEKTTNTKDEFLSRFKKTDRLIIRTEYPQIPPKVEYSLSERGKSLMTVLDQLCIWGEENRLVK